MNLFKFHKSNNYYNSSLLLYSYLPIYNFILLRSFKFSIEKTNYLTTSFL